MVELWIAIGVSCVGLTVLAAVSVATRSLSRLQRRALTGAATEDADDADSSVAVEVTFIALGMARQILAIVITMQVTALGRVVPLGPTWLGTVAVALLLYILFDKIVPYWLVAWAGARPVLTIGRPLSSPVLFLLGPAAQYLARTVGRARDLNRGEHDSVERSDLGALLDLAEEEGVVSASEESLLRGVADFEDAVVREIMTPRVDTVFVRAQATLEELRDVIAESRLSRIPVVEEDLDHVVGIAHLKDLLPSLGDPEKLVALIMRPAHFVPETKQVSELLAEFQHRREQMAIVVDEYGGTAGLVTLEDVLEEIVGEIQDEDEAAEVLLQQQTDGAYLVSGKAEIADVSTALGQPIDNGGEFTTVGGMVFSHLGRVPTRGDEIQIGDLRIEVLDADERRVHQVRMRVE